MTGAPGETRRASWFQPQFVIYLVAAAAVALRLAVAARSDFTIDDSYISLRYADHIARGLGFTFNSGERILGTTTPLYTLLLAALLRLRLPALAICKLINILADGALCIVAAEWVKAVLGGVPEGRLAIGDRRRTMTDGAAITAALLVALNPQHIRWSVSGMETSLAALCGAIVWLLYTRGRYLGAFVTLGILFLLRWDSLLMLVVLTAAVTWRTRKAPVRELAVCALIVAPWLLFATKYFGSPIPVTAASKIAVYGWRFDHAGTWVGRHLPQLGRLARVAVGSPLSCACTAFAVYAAWFSWRRRISSLAAPAAWFGIYWAAFLASRILLFPWYLPPAIIVFEIFAAIGVGAMLAKMERLVRAPFVQAGLWMGAAAAFAGTFVLVAGSMRETQRLEGDLAQSIGEWLGGAARQGDRVALEPIGEIGYFSHVRVVDFVGLVTPWTTSCYRPGALAPMGEAARRSRAEWCILRPGELQHILDADSRRPPGDRWGDLYGRSIIFTSHGKGGSVIVFNVFHRKDCAERTLSDAGPAE